MRMRLTTSSFEPGGTIPAQFTCEGKDVSPEFEWQHAPRETKSFVLILHDPDAPMADGFTHWVFYNIPPNISRLDGYRPRYQKIPSMGIVVNHDAGHIRYDTKY